MKKIKMMFLVLSIPLIFAGCHFFSFGDDFDEALKSELQAEPDEPIFEIQDGAMPIDPQPSSQAAENGGAEAIDEEKAEDAKLTAQIISQIFPAPKEKEGAEKQEVISFPDDKKIEIKLIEKIEPQILSSEPEIKSLLEGLKKEESFKIVTEVLQEAPLEVVKQVLMSEELISNPAIEEIKFRAFEGYIKENLKIDSDKMEISILGVSIPAEEVVKWQAQGVEAVVEREMLQAEIKAVKQDTVQMQYSAQARQDASVQSNRPVKRIWRAPCTT